MKKTISLLVVLTIVVITIASLLSYPIAYAATDLSSYNATINGKSVTITPGMISHAVGAAVYNNKCKSMEVGTSGHVCCAGYAAALFKQLWGTSFSSSSVSNMLGNLSTEQRRISVERLQYFFSSAAPGASVRFDKGKDTWRTDNGHELIFLGKTSNGGVFWEGNFNGKGSRRIWSCTWSELYKRFNDRGYIYMPYIKYPNAKKISPLELPEEPTISGATYPTKLDNGKSFGLRGTISCKYTITSITARIYDGLTREVAIDRTDNSKIIERSVSPNSTSYTIGNPTSETINSTLAFNKLPYNNYYRYIIEVTYSKDGNSFKTTVLDKPFTVGTVTPTLALSSQDGEFTLSETQYFSIGQEIPLRVTIENNYDEDVTANSSITSSNNAIASINGNTLIVNGQGEVIITATFSGVSCSATVNICQTYMEPEYTYSLDDGFATITSYNGAGGSITIPSEIDGYAVKKIGSGAFSGNNAITQVTVSEGIEEIGDNAFSVCGNLATVSLPVSLTRIGNNAFECCEALESITLPANVQSVGNFAFMECGSLASVQFANPHTVLGGGAFNACTSLTSVDLPAGITEVSEGLFSGCAALERVTIPDCVTDIQYYAFRGCSSLTWIRLPDDLQTIGMGAFEGTALDSVIISTDVTTIGDSAFYNCESLTDVFVPYGITDIGEDAFAECENILVHVIEGSAAISYMQENNINYVVYRPTPRSVTLNVHELTLRPGETYQLYATVYPFYANPVCRWQSNNHAVVTVSNTGLVTAVGPGSADIACLAENDDGTIDFVDVTVILDTVMTSPDLLLPSALTTIEDEAFAYTPAAWIKLSDNVTTIGNRAFGDCHNLTQIYIPPTATSIHPYAFEGVPQEMVIFGESGSEAETFANEHGYAFSVTNGTPVTEYCYRDFNASYSAWEWGEWTSTRQTITDPDTMQEEVRTAQYGWWAAKCKNCGQHNPFWGSSTKCKKCGNYLPQANISSVYAYTDDVGTTQSILGRDGGRYIDSLPYWRQSESNDRKEYRYATRTVLSTGWWGPWSSWSTEKPEELPNREIKQRTVYQTPTAAHAGNPITD